MSQGIDQELLAVFLDEANDQVSRLSRLLLELEGKEAADVPEKLLREIFRLAHTLKGSANTVGRDDIGSVAHQLESGLDLLRRKQLRPTKSFLDALLLGLDAIQAALEGPLPPARFEEVVARIQAVVRAPGEKPASSPPGGGPAHAAASVAEPAAERQALELLTAVLGQLAALAEPGGGVGVPNVAAQLEQLEAGVRSLNKPQSLRVLAHCRRALGGGHAGSKAVAKRVVDGLALGMDFIRTDLLEGASPEEAAVIDVVLRPEPGAEPVSSPERAPERSVAPSASEAFLRVPVSLLDSIVYRTDELVALKLRLEHQRKQVEDVQALVDTSLGRAASALTQSLSVESSESLRRTLEGIRRNLEQEVHFLGLVTQGLSDDVKDVRMLPVGPLFEPFRRMVRDVASSLGKEAVLEIEGENVRVDKRVLELMRDPLMHILRNAIDHGLETTEDRLKAGKPPRGTITLTAESRDAFIWLHVEDDGAGIDPSTLRRTAVKRGLLTQARADTLTDREALNLIFMPGFSTAQEVTELSGRGVGLDVVRENVARIGGKTEFYSTLGKGTEFSLCLPLTVSASNGLLVRSGKDVFCLPLTVVEEVLVLEPKDVGMTHGQLAINRRRQTISFTWLPELLGGRPAHRPSSECHAVIIAVSDRRVALGVDDVLGQEEVVVKGLFPGTPALPFISGATTLADGRLVAVLDLGQVLEAAMGHSGAFSGSPGRKLPLTVLVADDSLTSRTLISSVLEQAGYRTLVAPDGEKAFELFQSEQVDLLVTDGEMPNVDGFELIRRVRAGGRTALVPTILITSLSAPEDKRRGAEAGANAYFVKQQFDPAGFLSMVGDLLGSAKERA